MSETLQIHWKTLFKTFFYLFKQVALCNVMYIKV
jgi:hypothetical protein